jgi:diguanylate cyclase (GGDEF)-like protein/PAS domain S-box-containing protein
LRVICQKLRLVLDAPAAIAAWYRRRRRRSGAQALAQAVDHLHDALLIADEHGRVEWANDGFCRLTGFKLTWALRRPLVYTIRRIDARRMNLDALEQALSSRQRYETELLTVGAGNQPGRWIRLEVRPMPDADGRVDRFLILGTDLSGQRAYESALRREQALLQQVLQALPQRVYWTDRDGRLVGCNAAYARLAGAGSLRDVPHDRERAIGGTADEITRRRESDAYVRETGESLLNLEETLHHADGTVSSFTSTRTPLRDESGAVIGVLGSLTDITARKRAEQLLAENERFARNTVDALTAQIAILDEHGTVLATNRAWDAFGSAHGLAGNEQSGGWNYLQVCDAAVGSCAADAQRVAAGIREVIAGFAPHFSHEYACHAPDAQHWYVVRVSRFAGVGPVRVVVAHENVTDRRLAEDRLRFESLHDPLTQLPNRALLEHELSRCIDRAARAPGYRYAVLLLDLDRFKVINDSLGHLAGDRLLEITAGRIDAMLRPVEHLPGRPLAAMVARLGGDELVVLLDQLADPSELPAFASRLLETIAEPVPFDEHELVTTASVGILVAADDYRSPDELLRDADVAMYRAKAEGRSRHATFDAAMLAEAQTRLAVERDLRLAVARDELQLLYQPIVSLSSRQLVGFEALMRWRRDGRMISPADFIPIAEETGTIVSMGRWALETACRQLVAWRSSLPRAEALTMAVNVSRRQLTACGFVESVREVVERTGVPPGSLKLEITESVVMDDNDLTQSLLRRLKAIGVSLSMDDFGTGYSSLSCLHRFPIDVLKIDRAFMLNLSDRRDAAAVVTAILNLAHNLGMQVVAEGLERPEQVAFLQSMDCDHGQGYLFGKPMPVADAERFILTGPAPLALSA